MNSSILRTDGHEFVFPFREKPFQIRKIELSQMFCYRYIGFRAALSVVLNQNLLFLHPMRRLLTMKKLLVKLLILGALALSATAAFPVQSAFDTPAPYPCDFPGFPRCPPPSLTK
jgi:hypothetical protein